MKRIICTLLALLMVCGLLTSTALAAESDTETISLLSLPFEDVNTGNWFYPYVDAMYTSDIMMGINDTTFSPQGTFSRAQVLATLFRIHHGRPAGMHDPRNNNFTDVTATTWSAPYITWAANNGITTTTGGTFGPGQAAVRQEIALFMHRYIANLTDISDSSAETAAWTAFSDRNQIVGQEAYQALRWANNQGVIQGIVSQGVSRIAPMDTVTRAQAATMLARLMEDVTGWPQPQRINLAELLGEPFDAAEHLFGHALGTVPGVFDVTYRFRSGILVGLNASRTIVSLQVDYARSRPSIVFHYNEIDSSSTRQDVRARLGAPSSSDGVSYAYWLSGEALQGPVLSFFFDSLNNDRVSDILFTYFE